MRPEIYERPRFPEPNLAAAQQCADFEERFGAGKGHCTCIALKVEETHADGFRYPPHLVCCRCNYRWALNNSNGPEG